ncbi:MAG: PQQ-binding-like beta-propeller repeat protein [Opitutales bacterium]
MGVFGLLGTSVHAADWPQYRGPDRNGIAPGGKLLEWPELGPERLWTANVGIGVSAFVAAEGMAYTVGNKDGEDVVTAFKADTGDVVWTHKYPIELDARMFEGGPASTPAYADGILYTLSHQGHLKALNAKTGELGWEKHLLNDLDGRRPRWGFSSAPLVVDGMVVVEPGGRNASIVALDAKTGAVKWKAGSSEAGYSSPIAYTHRGQDTLLVFNAYGIIAHALSSGKELWKKRWDTSYDVNAAVPLAADEKVFISSGYGKGSALLDVGGSSPKTVWEHDKFQNQLTSSVLYEGHLYGFNVHHIGRKRGQSLMCVELDSGEIKWTDDSLGSGQLILVDNKLVIFTTDGELAIATPSPSRYQEEARMQALPRQSWVEPAYADGIVFLRNNDGRAAAFRIGEAN